MSQRASPFRSANSSVIWDALDSEQWGAENYGSLSAGGCYRRPAVSRKGIPDRCASATLSMRDDLWHAELYHSAGVAVSTAKPSTIAETAKPLAYTSALPLAIESERFTCHRRPARIHRKDPRGMLPNFTSVFLHVQPQLFHTKTVHENNTRHLEIRTRLATESSHMLAVSAYISS